MKPYGCFDRPPYKSSQVLYGHDSLTGKVITIEIPNRLAQDCRYTHTDLGQADARCLGCKWRVDKRPVTYSLLLGKVFRGDEEVPSGDGPVVAQAPSGAELHGYQPIPVTGPIANPPKTL